MKYFLLTGPTAAGKSAIMEYMLLKDKDYLTPVISFTTRERRNNEVQNQDYYFITRDQYLEYCQKMLVVEQISFMDQVYGVSADEIKRIEATGKNGLAIFTMNGIKELKERIGYQKVVSIFIYRDLSEIITAIRQARLGSAEQEERIRLAKEQIKYIDACNHVVFNIGSLEDAYQEISGIMRREIDSRMEDVEVKDGQRFTNYNKEIVEVVSGIAENTTNGTACIVYRKVNDKKLLVSPYEQFASSPARNPGGNPMAKYYLLSNEDSGSNRV